MKIRVCTAENITIKVFMVDNPIQISVIALKYEFWEYMAWVEMKDQKVLILTY